VRDHQAYLVNVTGQQHAWCAALEHGVRIAAHIGGYFVGKGPGLVTPDARGGGFVARRAGRAE
jgi:hypothetical protein